MVAALRVMLAAAWLLSGVMASSAENYPTRPVRIVVGFPAGGPTDAIARIVAQKLTDNLGQQFFVENIGGAGGNTAAGQVARVTPDGYTIMAISTGFIVNPSLYAKVPYDPVKDFAPVTLVAASPNVVVVNPQVPAKTLPELVQLIRDNPGKYSFAGPGVGSTPHLGGELFRLAFKLDLVHVPFTGAGPAVQATVGGHTPIAFTALPSSLSAVQARATACPWRGIDRTGRRAARCADLCRTGCEGSGRRHADGHRRASRNAERNRRPALSRDRQDRRPAGRQGAPHGARLQSGSQYAGTVRRTYQAGDRQMGQGGARRKAADRITRSAYPGSMAAASRTAPRGLHEGQADTVFLDPGDPALVYDRGIVCHHQTKVLRDEGRVVDIDRSALGRNIPDHAGMTEPPDET